MNYFPNSETVGPDEMRISFVGSCPFPPHRDQAGTCITVELGNGDRLFFDFGPGCVKNILGGSSKLGAEGVLPRPLSPYLKTRVDDEISPIIMAGDSTLSPGLCERLNQPDHRTNHRW